MMELQHANAGNHNFVAGFSQSNAGDVTPNTRGPVCNDTGLPCDGGKYSCPDGKGKFYISKCYASGPGVDAFDSTKIIGTKSLDAANALVAAFDGIPLEGTVDYRHIFIDMSNIKVPFNGSQVKTCKPAMGQSFAAGTTDGPGVDQAYQGPGPADPTLNILSHLVSYITVPLSAPSAELQACQAPKTVLLATGEYKIPYEWQPTILPIQLFTIGRKFVLIGQPSEITTMAGRRLREAIKVQMLQDGTVDQDAVVVIAGLSNIYSSYCTTYEEYTMQRYEAGSTIFGPHTLSAYIQEFTKLASSFATGVSPSSLLPIKEGSYPEFTLNDDVVHKIVTDNTPLSIQTFDPSCLCLRPNFGTVITQPPTSAVAGQKVSATFHCAHPRNHPTGSNFASVERLENNIWTTFLDDSGWDTKFFWTRTGGQVSPTSECLVEWSIQETAPVAAGTYRLRVFGTYKNGGLNKLFAFDGATQSFEVTV